MKFSLKATDPGSKARAGLVETDHGTIETPIFMPVGTAATVKGIHQKELKDVVEAQIILGNTYHLYLRPGIDIIKGAGGLHKFSGWDRPMLTDSGGYQVYSLSARRKIKEEGVTFQSHIDGSRHLFTPENNVDIQRVIGADIFMALDECTPYPCDYHYAKKSLGLTHRWLKRCCKRFDETEGLYGYQQAFFPIIQGSTFKDLRIESTEFVAALEREGNAIGGLSVGEPEDDLYAMTDVVCSILPKSKPRYLMGVGTPVNLLQCIALGVDMFDCVLPSRNARHGMLFTSRGIINIKNAKWKANYEAIDSESTSPTSRFHTKSYLRHLIHVGEALGGQIATLHNLSFYLWLVKEARQHIIAGDFNAWKNKMIPELSRRL